MKILIKGTPAPGLLPLSQLTPSSAKQVVGIWKLGQEMTYFC